MRPGIRRRTRRATAAVSALALCTVAWAGTQLLTGAPAARALTPPVALTADELPTWQTNGIVWATAQAHGVVFAGGTFSAIRPPGAPAGSGDERRALNLASFDAATGEPAGCAPEVTIGSGTAKVDALAVSPDGRTLYVGGSFGAVGGTGVSSLAAIDLATCTVRTSFRPSVPAPVHALAVTSDTVYFGGDFTSVAGHPRGRFAAVRTDGTLLPWDPGADRPGRAVEVLPGGGGAADGQRVAIGGDFDTVGAAHGESHALAVVDAGSGVPIRTYPGFIERTSVVKDITSDATGFYTGNEGTGGGVFDGRIALDLDDLDQRWRDTCLGATQSLVVHKSVLYSGSHAHDCSSMGEFPDGQRRHLLAESVDDPTLLGWFPDTNDGLVEAIGPRSLTVAPAGGTDYLWVGGTFTTVGGSPQQGLTRFADGPDTHVPYVPETSAASTGPGTVELRWRSSLDLDDSELTYRVYRDGGATPVHTATGRSTPWLRPQLTFTDTSLAPGSTHTYRVTASDGRNTSGLSPTVSVTVATAPDAYAAQVRADGPVLYWRYDDAQGAFAADSSGTGNSGVHHGGPARGTAPGAVPGASRAITYDGTGGQFTHSDRPSGRQPAYSVETWFRTSTTRGGKLIGFGDRYQLTSASYDKHLYLRDDGRLVWGVHDGGTRTATTPAAYNDGRWHHAVGTVGGDGMRLYVDGALRASAAATGSQAFTGYWRVGGDNLSGWPGRPTGDFYGGQLDETAVYHKVLTAAQVARHYTRGSR